MPGTWYAIVKYPDQQRQTSSFDFLVKTATTMYANSLQPARCGTLRKIIEYLVYTWCENAHNRCSRAVEQTDFSTRTNQWDMTSRMDGTTAPAPAPALRIDRQFRAAAWRLWAIGGKGLQQIKSYPMKPCWLLVYTAEQRVRAWYVSYVRTGCWHHVLFLGDHLDPSPSGCCVHRYTFCAAKHVSHEG